MNTSSNVGVIARRSPASFSASLSSAPIAGLRYPPAPTGNRSRRRSATALRVSANSAAISP